jgi:hypothetical protein
MLWLFDEILDTSLPTASFVGRQTFTSSPSSTLSSLGAITGDVAIVLRAFGNVSSGSGGTWNSFSIYDANLNLYWKRLVAGDLSSGITTNDGGGGVLVIYRGASSIVSLKTATVSGSPDPKTFSGTVPAANSAGIFAIARTIGAGSDSYPISPGTWTPRSGVSFFSDRATITDRLAPPNLPYAGENFTIQRDSGTAYDAYVALFQFIL